MLAKQLGGKSTMLLRKLEKITRDSLTSAPAVYTLSIIHFVKV
jgi:hypothetical protein